MPKSTSISNKRSKKLTTVGGTDEPSVRIVIPTAHKQSIAAVDGGSDSLSGYKISRFKKPSWKEYRSRPRVKNPAKLLPAWQIGREAAGILRNNPTLFLGISLVYLVLTLLLVKGFSISTDSFDLKTILQGGVGSIANGLLVFTLLATSAGNNSSQVAGVYQTFLAIVVSLAAVWTLRKIYAGTEHIRVRDSFYRGMYPLVPVLLVILAMGIQLLPMVIGAGLYSIVMSQGIAVSWIEHVIWIVVGLLLALWSFRMITASIFALYIAALPDMTPMRALRSAREIVQFRRWTVLRRLLFLPLCLLVVSLVIMLPVIMYATSLAQWAFFLLTIAGLPIVHAYLYTLYRDLLK